MNDPVSDQPVEAAIDHKLPWSVAYNTTDGTVIRNSHGINVAIAPDWNAELAANAALIVHSVNRAQQYEAMAEALRAIRKMCDVPDLDDVPNSEVCAIVDEACMLAHNAMSLSEEPRLPTTPKDKPLPSTKPTCEDCGASDCTLHHLCGTCAAK